jgi:serine/threonine protein kinase
MIDQNGHARLADFGLLTIISDSTNSTASSSSLKGTTRWMSPELLKAQFGTEHVRPTKESDCYAFGMVIYEVLSRQIPFTSDKNKWTVMQKVIEGGRPERPKGVKGEWFVGDLWKTLEMCWAAEPESRPSIQAVFECLEQVPRDWKPSSPQMDEDVEVDEYESSIGISAVSNSSRLADRVFNLLSELIPSVSALSSQ